MTTHNQPLTPGATIRIEKCTSPSAWYAERIGQTLKIERHEINRSPSQGIPEDVYWCRTGDRCNTLNYVRASDATALSDTHARRPRLSTPMKSTTTPDRDVGSSDSSACDTPSSNAACAAWESGEGDGPSVSLEHAQKLERELTALRSEIREARRSWLGGDYDHLSLFDALEKFRADQDALRSADEPTSAILDEPIEWSFFDEKWREAIEESSDLARLRSENTRLATKITAQSHRISYLEGATHHATGTPLSKAILRAEKAEAQLAAAAEREAKLREALVPVHGNKT